MDTAGIIYQTLEIPRPFEKDDLNYFDVDNNTVSQISDRDFLDTLESSNRIFGLYSRRGRIYHTFGEPGSFPKDIKHFQVYISDDRATRESSRYFLLYAIHHYLYIGTSSRQSAPQITKNVFQPLAMYCDFTEISKVKQIIESHCSDIDDLRKGKKHSSRGEQALYRDYINLPAAYSGPSGIFVSGLTGANHRHVSVNVEEVFLN